jgi:hypothetical protein
MKTCTCVTFVVHASTLNKTYLYIYLSIYLFIYHNDILHMFVVFLKKSLTTEKIAPPPPFCFGYCDPH